jgi:hypothetical protein
LLKTGGANEGTCDTDGDGDDDDDDDDDECLSFLPTTRLLLSLFLLSIASVGDEEDLEREERLNIPIVVNIVWL